MPKPKPSPVQGKRATPPAQIFAAIFGAFLGLALLKFGNPIILNNIVFPPESFSEFIDFAWPPLWAVWFLLPLALVGLVLAIKSSAAWPASRWLWILPLAWFGWQLISAMHSVDGKLTTLTLLQFGGCLACYFLGALVVGKERGLRWLLVGLLAAFAFCLVKAVNQRMYEFPWELRWMRENERSSWTNLPPELVLQMKRDGGIITTNGVDIANPVFIAKYEKGRVHGTLVYANALAGAVLLLWPVSIALAVTGTRRFRTLTRVAAMALTILVGGTALFWTGSKSGWLIGLLMSGVCLFQLKWPARAKWIVLSLAMAVGLAVFAVRFQNYFASGAKSVGARFDYWRIALQVVSERPWVGSGPGTFQRPHALLKNKDSEMARLVHNDYLEQFSDSGIPGGICYAMWIGLLLWILGRELRKCATRLPETENSICFGLFIGVLGWFVQGVSEFALYVPALAWTAFALAGCLLASRIEGNDSTRPAVQR